MVSKMQPFESASFLKLCLACIHENGGIRKWHRKKHNMLLFPSVFWGVLIVCMIGKNMSKSICFEMKRN